MPEDGEYSSLILIKVVLLILELVAVVSI